MVDKLQYKRRSPKQAEAILRRMVRKCLEEKRKQESADRESYPIRTRELPYHERKMMELMEEEFRNQGKTLNP